MPSLWQHMKVLAVVIIFITVIVAWDSVHPPDKEVSVRVAVSMIDVYQTIGRPVLKGHVQCRFVPSCSDYSNMFSISMGLSKGPG